MVVIATVPSSPQIIMLQNGGRAAVISRCSDALMQARSPH
jgi:hypothetical protein